MFKQILRSARQVVLAPTNANYALDNSLINRGGLLCILLHPFFYVVDILLAQPFESFWLRAAMVILAIPLLGFQKVRATFGRFAEWLYHIIVFAEVIGFPFIMYCQNQTGFWLAVLCNCILVCFVAVEFRMALFYMLCGAITGVVSSAIFPPGVVPSFDLSAGFASLFSLMMGTWISLRMTIGQKDRLKYAQLSVGVLAHELRTPLASVDVVASRLKEHEDEIVRRSAQLIDDSLTRANKLIDQQINNSRLLSASWNYEEVPVAQCVKEAVAEFLSSVPEGGAVSIVVDIQQDFEVLGNFGHLRRVIINLVKNANRAVLAADRGAAGTVKVLVSCEGRKGLIEVSDNGVGIEPSQLVLIWKAFHSTSLRLSHGLGLYYVRHVIEAKFSGTIRVASKVGVGSTFTLSLRNLRKDGSSSISGAAP